MKIIYQVRLQKEKFLYSLNSHEKNVTIFNQIWLSGYPYDVMGCSIIFDVHPLQNPRIMYALSFIFSVDFLREICKKMKRLQLSRETSCLFHVWSCNYKQKNLQRIKKYTN